MKALKLGLFCCLLGCLPAAAAVVPVLPAPLVGNYQALLFTGMDVTGTPAGLVTLTTTSAGKITGKLTTDENKTYAFKGTFNYVPDTFVGDELEGISTAAPISIARGKLTALSLTLTIVHNKADGVDVPVLKAVLGGTGADELIPKRISNSGFRNITFASKVTANWEGKYTMALEGAEAAAQGVPQGSGYATGVVAKTGVMTLAGKTGDGVVFTASLPAGPNKNYVAYLNPYKTPTSFLAGGFTLTPRVGPATGFQVVAAETGVDFKWRKAAKATDKVYPGGFGLVTPVGLLATMEPWLALLSKQTLAQAYGMGADDAFNIGFGGDFSATVLSTRTPTKLGLNAKNTFYIAAGGVGSPSAAVPANWAKIFSIKVVPTTGVLTGTLSIVTSVPVAGKPNKDVPRKLTLAGVMLRPATIGSGVFAVGSVSIPPLDPKTGSTVTVAFSFSGPFETAPLVASAAAIAGNYHAIFDLTNLAFPGTPKPNETPANGATANFSIASDLKYMVFNGRTVPLSSDSRPLNLTFLSLSNPKLNVTLTFSLVTGDLIKCDATYLIPSKGAFYSVSRNNPQSIVKD